MVQRICKIIGSWAGRMLASMLLVAPAAQGQPTRIMVVAAPYVEFHTGPGRGYPIFHVLERGAEAEIVNGKPGWFKVRAQDGIEGWVAQSQIEETLAENGHANELPKPTLGDQPSRRLELAIGLGVVEHHSAATLKARANFRSNLGLEISYLQASENINDARFYDLSLVKTLQPDWTVIPSLNIGIGYRDEDRTGSVTTDDADGMSINAGLGLRGYLSRHFVLRADLQHRLILPDGGGSEQVQEFTAGFGFVF